MGAPARTWHQMRKRALNPPVPLMALRNYRAPAGTP